MLHLKSSETDQKNTNFVKEGVDMTDKYIKKLVSKVERHGVEVSKDEKKSKTFLKKAGIITKTGKVTKNYRHLCIRPGQA